jgi:hypothetical protein
MEKQMTNTNNAKLISARAGLFLLFSVAVLVFSSINPMRAQNAPPPASDKVQWEPGDNCVDYKDEKDINDELRSGRHPVGPRLLNTAWFLAAGASNDVVLATPFDQNAVYFGYIESRDRRISQAGLDRSAISADKVPEKNRFVTDGLAKKDDTLLTIRLPDSAASFWKRATLFIYACKAPGSPAWVSRLDARVSPPFYSSVIVWAAVAVLFALAATATREGNTGADWFRSFNPVRIAAGSDGKASLSKLQIMFFSIIVFGLVTYIFLRTGMLSDLSETILYLLGIAGLGTLAAKGADDARNRVTPENEAWLISKGQLPAGGLAAKNTPSWRDLITSNGEFDVSRYQNLIFTLAIGAALIAHGISELASFVVPMNLLGLLGLSQAVYVGGKVVGFSPAGELNSTVEKLRQAESAGVAPGSATTQQQAVHSLLNKMTQ